MMAPCGPVNSTRPSPPLSPLAGIARVLRFLVHPRRGSIISSSFVCLLPVQDATTNGWVCIEMKERMPTEGIYILTYCPAFISKASCRTMVSCTGPLSLVSGYLKTSPTLGNFRPLDRAINPLRDSRNHPSYTEVTIKIPRLI